MVIHTDFVGCADLMLLNCVKLIPRSERQWIIVPSSFHPHEPQENAPCTVKKEPKNCHSDTALWQFQQFHGDSRGCTEPSAQLGLVILSIKLSKPPVPRCVFC